MQEAPEVEAKEPRILTTEDVMRMNPKPYRRRPTLILAAQVNEPFTVASRHGPVSGQAGDYVMVSPSGELYPCSQEMFSKLYYQAVEDVKKMLRNKRRRERRARR